MPSGSRWSRASSQPHGDGERLPLARPVEPVLQDRHQIPARARGIVVEQPRLRVDARRLAGGVVDVPRAPRPPLRLPLPARRRPAAWPRAPAPARWRLPPSRGAAALLRRDDARAPRHLSRPPPRSGPRPSWTTCCASRPACAGWGSSGVTAPPPARAAARAASTSPRAAAACTASTSPSAATARPTVRTADAASPWSPGSRHAAPTPRAMPAACLRVVPGGRAGRALGPLRTLPRLLRLHLRPAVHQHPQPPRPPLASFYRTLQGRRGSASARNSYSTRMRAPPRTSTFPPKKDDLLPS